MTTPALSILMPSFQSAPFVVAAARSAVEQFGPDDELVIQDGGSTDGTLDALRAAFGGDDRVSVVSEPDGGQSDALQRALGRARNPFIGWLNADDLYYPGALGAVRRALAADPRADVVYGTATVFSENGAVLRRTEPIGFTVAEFVEHGCGVFSGATFFRTDLVREVGGFDATLHYAMDFDLFLRVAERSPRAVRVPEALGGLRWHAASKSGTSSMPFFREALRIRLAHTRSVRDRLHVYAHMGRRLAAVPLLPLRNSERLARLRGIS